MPTHTLTKDEQQERKRRIIELRGERQTWDQIATAFDITPQRAHQLYQAALKERPNPLVDEHRAEEAALIDRAVNRLLQIAEVDDVSPRTRVEAWNAIKGWCEHKARLLGLNAPARKEITVLTEDAVDQALRALEEQHKAKAAELEALEQRAIAGAKEALAEMESVS